MFTKTKAKTLKDLVREEKKGALINPVYAKGTEGLVYVEGAAPRPVESDPTGKQPNEPGAKLDAGKVDVALLDDFAEALYEVARVATYGAVKYSRKGWMEVPDGVNRYRAAAGRHRLDAKIQGPIDPTTGLMHEAQEAWNVLAALTLKLRGKR